MSNQTQCCPAQVFQPRSKEYIFLCTFVFFFSFWGWLYFLEVAFFKDLQFRRHFFWNFLWFSYSSLSASLTSNFFCFSVWVKWENINTIRIINMGRTPIHVSLTWWGQINTFEFWISFFFFITLNTFFYLVPLKYLLMNHFNTSI